MLKSEWMVQVPVSELLALMGLEDELTTVRAENKQLRRELDGLRLVQTQCMEVVGDLRQQLRQYSGGR